MCLYWLQHYPMALAFTSKKRLKLQPLIDFGGRYIYHDSHEKTDYNSICSDHNSFSKWPRLPVLLALLLFHWHPNNNNNRNTNSIYRTKIQWGIHRQLYNTIYNHAAWWSIVCWTGVFSVAFGKCCYRRTSIDKERIRSDYWTIRTKIDLRTGATHKDWKHREIVQRHR